MGSIDNLEKLGLSEAEAAVFLFLTQHGATLAPQIQSALGMAKVPAYRALNGLIARELVTAAGEPRRLKYTAEPTAKLLELYDRNIKEMHAARSGLEAFIETLAKQQNEFYKERKISVYEGLEGWRLWMEERLRGDVEMVREIGHNVFWQDFAETPERGQADTMKIAYARVAKGIPLRSVYTRDRDLPPNARTRSDLMKEVKFLKIESPGSLCLSMFGPRMGYFSGDGSNYRGIIVDDAILTAMLTGMFDLLWGQGEVVSL